ncbi:MAG: pyrimidine reductase family protein, partial [Mycobacterium sp.]
HSTQFSALGGDEAIDADDLHRLYEYPDALTRPLVRGNAIASLDGAATTAGTSGGLGGPGDRRLFGVQREMADVIVVGAGTVRAENYGGARLSVAQRQRRRTRGQSEVPPIALVTRTGVVDHDSPVLTSTEVPPLVLTCTRSADAARGRLGGRAEVLDCSGSDPHGVDLEVALQHLGERGLLRVLTEGGPSLLGAFIAADLLDEMCLTTAPMVVGGGAVRIATGPAEVLSRMRRAHLLADDDGYLYARYVRLG